MSFRQLFLTCLSVALLCVCASCTTSAPPDSKPFKHQAWGQRWDWGAYQMDTGDRGNTNFVTTAEVYDWCTNILSRRAEENEMLRKREREKGNDCE